MQVIPWPVTAYAGLYPISGLISIMLRKRQKCKHHFSRNECIWEAKRRLQDNIETDLGDTVREGGLGSSSSGQSPLTGSSQHGDERVK